MPAKSTGPKPDALAVIILAAGASRRMGRSKLLLPWNGTTVIGHLIARWRALSAAQTAVVCRADDEELAAELDRLHFPRNLRITNPKPERGMFSSIQCAAQWNGWRKGLTVWAILLGDQPHLHPATLRALLDFQRARPRAICQPVYAGHRRHPVLLPRRVFAALRRSRAITLKDFLQQSEAPRAECPLTDPGLDLDLDYPEDYERAQELVPEMDHNPKRNRRPAQSCDKNKQ